MCSIALAKQRAYDLERVREVMVEEVILRADLILLDLVAIELKELKRLSFALHCRPSLINAMNFV